MIEHDPVPDFALQRQIYDRKLVCDFLHFSFHAFTFFDGVFHRWWWMLFREFLFQHLVNRRQFLGGIRHQCFGMFVLCKRLGEGNGTFAALW